MAIQASVLLKNGVSITGAYIVVDILKSKINYDGGCRIDIYVFAGYEFREKKIPAATGSILVSSEHEDFETYFSESVVSQNGLSDSKQAYNYIKIKDGELSDELGFLIDWENTEDV